MYKILHSDRDAYITNKIVRGERKTSSNVGQAGTLDLFKLYGVTSSGSSPNVEVSRILVHFDLEPLRAAIDRGLTSPDDPSLTCKLRLRDVYGGQPTPINFSVSVFPLSASFTEGLGKDVSYLSDEDACNWLSSSRGVTWYVSGCSQAGGPSGPSDYITSSANLASTERTQIFASGEEDLVVDVTQVVSATLTGEIPDCGFRISFNNSLEDNTRTYFVKRFGSRHVYDESKRPSLLVGFDDSIDDDSQNLTFDTTASLSLYNYAGGALANILSGGSPVVGTDCILLRLTTPVSGGAYNLYFTGSQYSHVASAFLTGTYFAEASIPMSDPVITAKLQVSSSVEFTPVWTSLDGTVTFVTGSTLYAHPPSRTSTRSQNNFVVSVLRLKDVYGPDEKIEARVNIFDETSPLIKLTRVPVEHPGAVIKSVYYQVRDAVTNEIIMPFDESTGATRVSSDAVGMFFAFDADSLTVGRTYVVDILVSHNGMRTRYNNASPVFRVDPRGAT